MDPVKASPPSPLEPAAFLETFSVAARQAGFVEQPFGEIGGFPLRAYRRAGPEGAPKIYISSGIHGDEPAPPWSLLRMIEQGVLHRSASWFVCPLLNPRGFFRRTRENDFGVDLNRDYKEPRSAEIKAHVRWLQQQPMFDLVFCLHEDWEAKGFYLYELNPNRRPSLAPALLRGAGTHIPVETATIIDGREIDEPGIIRPISDPLLRETWPEAVYLREHHGTLHYTVETPSGWPLEQRVAALTGAVREALAAFRQ